MDDHQFTWILWYIWKGRNNNVFSNLDIDPRETLKITELESALWAEAHVINSQIMVHQVHDKSIPAIPRRWFFTDGSCKDKDIFSIQGW